MAHLEMVIPLWSCADDLIYKWNICPIIATDQKQPTHKPQRSEMSPFANVQLN